MILAAVKPHFLTRYLLQNLDFRSHQVIKVIIYLDNAALIHHKHIALIFLMYHLNHHCKLTKISVKCLVGFVLHYFVLAVTKPYIDTLSVSTGNKLFLYVLININLLHISILHDLAYFSIIQSTLQTVKVKLPICILSRRIFTET